MILFSMNKIKITKDEKIKQLEEYIHFRKYESHSIGSRALINQLIKENDWKDYRYEDLKAEFQEYRNKYQREKIGDIIDERVKSYLIRTIDEYTDKYFMIKAKVFDPNFFKDYKIKIREHRQGYGELYSIMSETSLIIKKLEELKNYIEKY